MRALAAAVVLALASLVPLGGCGKSEEVTPAACLQGPGAYARALAAAPGEVKLGGETPISDCLTENQSGGELAQVGESLVLTATKLNAAARAQPTGDAALQLGYLVGAVERGSEDTEGIHSDLLRRLTVAARYQPGRRPLPSGFAKSYEEGFEAGRAGR